MPHKDLDYGVEAGVTEHYGFHLLHSLVQVLFALAGVHGAHLMQELQEDDNVVGHPEGEEYEDQDQQKPDNFWVSSEISWPLDGDDRQVAEHHH